MEIFKQNKIFPREIISFFFFFFLVVKKAYFIPSTPKNNIKMKNILWSRKSSLPPWSVLCEGREAARTSSFGEVSGAAMGAILRIKPEGWGGFFWKSGVCKVL